MPATRISSPGSGDDPTTTATNSGTLHQSADSRTRLFLTVFAKTWLLTTGGGAACGLVSIGLLSVLLFFFTIPYGTVLGGVLGLPLGLIIAATVSLLANPPRSGPKFARNMESVGVLAGLAVNLPINAYLVCAQANDSSSLYPETALICNAVLSLTATVLIGRECGHALAADHLRRFSIDVPPRNPLFGSGRAVVAHANAMRNGKHAEHEIPSDVTSDPTAD